MSLALAALAACQKDSLQPGGPSGGIKPFPDGGQTGAGASGGTGSTTGAFDGGFAGFGSSIGTGGAGGSVAPLPDYGASACVMTSAQLPWTTVTGTLTRLEVVVANDGSAIAVLNRQPTQLDVRTYRRDGTPLGGRQFAPDVQLLPYGGDHFLLIAHGVTGDFTGTDVAADVTGGARKFMVPSTATEQVRAIVAGPPIVLLTSERFVNATTGAAVAWTTTLGPDAEAFASGRVYGAVAQANNILVAGGMGRSLGLMVLDTDGNVIRSGVDAQGLSELAAASQTTTTMPFAGGLLMFDGNPPLLTQIGFDLSRTQLGEHKQLETFSRTAPRVAPIQIMGRPVGIFLTVFPGTDNTQGNTLHRLYACGLDVSDPATCATALPIAQTGLDGYGIAEAPVAAAALPDGRTFAVAHSDAANRTWLRIADMTCTTSNGLN